MARGNVFEDEWDEAVVIGGKKLPGWLEEEEGKKEVERVGKILDDLSEQVFFSIPPKGKKLIFVDHHLLFNV